MTYEIKKITPNDLNQILLDAKSDPHCDPDLLDNLEFLIKDELYALDFINRWVVDSDKKTYLFRTCPIVMEMRLGETYNVYIHGRMYGINTFSMFESKIYFTTESKPDISTFHRIESTIVQLFTLLNPYDAVTLDSPIVFIDNPEAKQQDSRTAGQDPTRPLTFEESKTGYSRPFLFIDTGIGQGDKLDLFGDPNFRPSTQAHDDALNEKLNFVIDGKAGIGQFAPKNPKCIFPIGHRPSQRRSGSPRQLSNHRAGQIQRPECIRSKRAIYLTGSSTSKFACRRA